MGAEVKFKRTDDHYLASRNQLSEKFGPRELWSTIDHWPLYCGVFNLARYLAITNIFRDTLNVPGDIAEFGSWRGANLMLLAKLLRIYAPNGPKVVHSFDSFEGLSAFDSKDGKATERKGQYKGSLEELRELIHLYGMEDEVLIHKGLIEDTLPKALSDRPELTVSFVYCDTDLYESTRTILEALHPRLAKGGVFVLDEWNAQPFPGEGIAVNEFLAKYGDHYLVESIPHTRQPTLALRKLKY